MSELVRFAKSELARIRTPGDEPDEMQDAIEENVLKIVEAFANGGHSGSSAPYTIAIVEKVLRFEPLTPLTGADDEWNEITEGDDPRWQNRRCAHVFKRADGTAYDIEAVVFRDPDGLCFTSRDSRRDITFPYVPKTEIVDRSSAAASADDTTHSSMPNPTPDELASPQFEAIWQAIKSWDVNVPEAYGGYCGANGSHVAVILRALAPT